MRDMFSADLVADRVVDRYLAAKGKGGAVLRPEYEKALNALEKGDTEPLRAFGEKVQQLILPNGVIPDWFGALGTAKRNALKSLHRDIEVNKGELSGVRKPDDPLEAALAEVYLTSIVKKVQSWGKAIRTLELATEIGNADREIQHGSLVVVPVPGVTKDDLNAALAALDAATDKVRAKFPQVLYGKIFLATHLKKGRAAQYVYPPTDALYLDVNAKKRFDDIYTICHEFGHRYDQKFLSQALRNKFWTLSTHKQYEFINFDEKLRDKMADEVVFLAKQQAIGKPLPKMSPELVAWLKSVDGPQNIKRYVSDFLTYTIDEKKLHAEAKGKKDALVSTGKVLKEPLAVTPYGATSPTENFAEAFAHYVLGKDLAPEFVEILNEAK